MKRNIDLTMSRDFDKRHLRSVDVSNIFNTKHTDSIREILNQRAWIDAESVIDKLQDEDAPLVYTGNKEDIKRVKFYNAMYDGTQCDRCGKYVYDWLPYNLCRICDKELEDDFRGMPWDLS